METKSLERASPAVSLALPDRDPFLDGDSGHALAQAIVDTLREPVLVLDKDLYALLVPFESVSQGQVEVRTDPDEGYLFSRMEGNVGKAVSPSRKSISEVRMGSSIVSP